MGKRGVFLLWAALVLCISVPVVRGQSLWGYYPINENDFKDYSGNQQDGTPVDGTVTVSDPERGWVVAFNKEPEKPSRINCGTNDPAAGGQLTVSVWTFWQGTNGNWQGMAGKSFSYDDRRWIFQLRDTDGMIQWGGSDRLNKHIFAQAAPAVNEWQHVVGACDGTTSKVYINGEVVGEGAGGFEPGAAGANVTLGFGEDRTDYDESFNGMMNEIYILSRGLSQAQVRDLATGILPDFTTARDPLPADGSLAVEAPLFRWTAGDGAVLHNVYLGTTAELGEPQLVGPRAVVPLYYHAPGLQAGTTYYWRVDEVEKDGITVHPGDVWTFTTQALTAYHPDPCDGALDASPRPTLTWLPGKGAVKHHVYFSNNRDAVARGDKATDKGEMTETSFAPGELQEARTYYWRVDEVVLGGEVVTGAVWQFHTYVRVDDFEKYTSDEGNRIFDVWIDGWGGNGTGSQVGYTNEPYCEQKIVHGGRQSMPLDYNNVNEPYYSEAEQEFPSSQDGSAYDVDTLVVWIHGRLGNSPAPFYVGLKDTHDNVGIVTHPDPNLVTLSKWTEWRVFMFDFMATGVDLSAVKKILIGVGDRNNPAPDGKGLIYIDDMAAIKTIFMDPNAAMIDPRAGMTP